MNLREARQEAVRAITRAYTIALQQRQAPEAVNKLHRGLKQRLAEGRNEALREVVRRLEGE